MLLMQNIFTSEVLILHRNRFNDPEGCNLSRGTMSIEGLRISSSSSSANSACVATGDGPMVVSLPLSPLTASVGSSLFVSIFISQASSSMLLEEQEDMMPSLTNLPRNSKKKRTEDFLCDTVVNRFGKYI